MTTKFKQKYAEITHILVLCKIWRLLHVRQVFGIGVHGEFDYAIRIFQGANGVAIAIKCRQK